MREVQITGEIMDTALKAYAGEASYPIVPANHQAALHAALSAALSGMAEPVKVTTINVNDQFAVRLMKGGYEQLVKAATIGEDRSTGIEYAAACHPEKPDGTRVFQLHELMRFFGPLMFNGNNELPFETTIEYLGDGLSAPPASDLREENETFQARVAKAHVALFHDDPTDVPERVARFFEEALETVQAFGMTPDEAEKLLDYTFSRPVGWPVKEIGSAFLTLTSLCVVAGIDASACAEADLEKLQRPETIDRIRAKRATRHGRGPLPGVDPEGK